MRQYITKFGTTVSVSDDQFKKDCVFQMVFDFFEKHNIIDADSLMQSDDPQIEAPELLASIFEMICASTTSDDN